MMRTAALDCGTNSLRLLVADVDPAAGSLTDLDRRLEIVRLGQGVDATGRLAPDALARTLGVLRSYAAIVEAAGVSAVRMVATSATRDAANAGEFVAGVRKILGIEPEVLSGEEEARLSFLGATAELAGRAAAPYLVVDIGGGSTEFVLGGPAPADTATVRADSARAGSVRADSARAGSARAGSVHADSVHADNVRADGVHADSAHADGVHADSTRAGSVRADGRGGSAGLAEAAVSVNIGCVRMTERHLHGDPPSAAEVAAARADIDAALDVVAGQVPVGQARTLVGLAGSVTTVAALVLGLESYQADRIHHARISAAAVHDQTVRLLAQTRAERGKLAVMHPGRVDVIGGGALVLDRIMDRFGFGEVLVSEHDILDGIAWSLAGDVPR